MTPDDIKQLPYTDFVGLINQWNVLPGAFDTLNRWRVYGQIDASSSILEIACTTGFSSRELALLTGARGHGIDLSAQSIESARHNQQRYAPDAALTYETADATLYTPTEQYSHVIVGASAKFFQDPHAMLARVKDFLVEGGSLLASPFYTTASVPDALIEKARKVFGITITTESYKDILWMYRDFEILYQERKAIEQETQQELEHYCASTIDRFKEAKPGLSEETYEAAYARLMEIKRMSNDLRPYQEYAVLVLRCRKELFGKRFVELF